MLFSGPLELSSVVAVTGGCFELARRFFGFLHRRAEKKTTDIIRIAKYEAELVRDLCDEKIKSLELELKTQKESVAKDLSHLKETYNAEMRVLGEKIEDLKLDIANQHQNLVALLTKLIDGR